MDPTFAPFVAWCREQDVPVTLVSDGFGFYIEPLLAAAGIDGVGITTNEQTWSADNRPSGMRFVSGHPECIGCGTCKMQAVLDAQRTRGAVAFAGEGQTDSVRRAVRRCDVRQARVGRPLRTRRCAVLPWNGFDDIRAWLESEAALPGPVAPVRCPGWTLPPI